MLNQQSSRVQQTFLRIFGGGSEGLKEQMLQTLFRLMLIAEKEQDFSKLTTVLRAMTDVCKTIYPEGVTIETTNIQVLQHPKVLQLTQVILEEIDGETRQRIEKRLEELVVEVADEGEEHGEEE